jgi:hypothetical protein
MANAASVTLRIGNINPLTVAEMDGNFTSLKNAINGVVDLTASTYSLLSVNCPTPTTSLQIANKSYVDNQINRYIGIATALGG